MTRADKIFNVSDLDIIELLQLYWGEQIHPNKYKLYISYYLMALNTRSPQLLEAMALPQADLLWNTIPYQL